MQSHARVLKPYYMCALVIVRFENSMFGVLRRRTRALCLLDFWCLLSEAATQGDVLDIPSVHLTETTFVLIATKSTVTGFIIIH